MDRNRGSGKIDEELLACRMLLAQHHVQALPPALVEFAEATVAITVRVSLAVLLPGQLQGEMRMALQLFVKAGKIRGRSGFSYKAPHAGTEQGLFQAAIIPAFRQRPGDTDRLGAFQIVMNRTLTDRTTAGDLALAQP